MNEQPPDPGFYETPTPSANEDLSYIEAHGTAIADFGSAGAVAQASSRILTQIGQITSAPQGTLAVQDISYATVNDWGMSDSNAENLSRLNAAFQYSDQLAGDQSFLGSIYVVGAAQHTINHGDYEHTYGGSGATLNVVVRKGSDVIANVSAQGSSSKSYYVWYPEQCYSIDEWELTADTVNLAQPIVMEGSSGFNFYINFVVPIYDGEIISYDVTFDSYSGSHPGGGESTSSQGSFGGSAVVWGQIIPGTPPQPPGGGGGSGGPGGGGPGSDGAPGDADGDGDSDGDDAAIFAQIVIEQNQAGRQPLVVTTEEDVDDSDYSFGDLSLREAIALAGNDTLYPGEDTIWFAPNVEHIEVASALMIASGNNVQIIGPGADKLTIDGNLATRVFTVSSGATATLRGLHITEGGGTGASGVASSGVLTIDQCLIDNSIARIGGGVNAMSGSTLNITNSTIANNSGTYSGGGVYLNASASGSIVNSTISSNTSPNGGGVYSASTTGVTIQNSTITANTATSSASAGGVQGNNILMHNTLVAGNTASTYRDIKGSFNSASSYNLIGVDDVTSNGIDNGILGNIVGSTSSPVDAQLGSLTDNGGALPTHALASTSQAVDAGNPSFSPGTWVYDQRAVGYPRMVDGNGDTVDRLDIGAIEYQPISPLMDSEELNALILDLSFKDVDSEDNVFAEYDSQYFALDQASQIGGPFIALSNEASNLPDSGSRRLRNVSENDVREELFAAIGA